MEVLTGASSDTALARLTIALGGEVLALGGLAADAADGEGRIANALSGGEAAEIFGEMVAELGGPADFVDRWPDRLPAAPVMIDIHPGEVGYVTAIDTHALGDVVVELGGGRLRQDDRVDPAVGLSDIARIGMQVDAETPLARIHAGAEDKGRAVAAKLRRAFTLADHPVDAPPLIHERIV